MARTRIWLILNDPRTLNGYTWSLLDSSPNHQSARFKVDQGTWTGSKGDQFHGVRIETIEKNRVEVSY